MASNYSSNQIHNHYGGSSRSSRASSGQRFRTPKCFCRIQTMVKYSTSEKNPGKAYHNCPNFPSGCDFICWIENYGEDEDNNAKVRELYDELVIQSLLRREEWDGERKNGYKEGAKHYSVFEFLCGVLVFMLIFLVFLK